METHFGAVQAHSGALEAHRGAVEFTMAHWNLGTWNGAMHCKPGQANASLKTATCEAGPGDNVYVQFRIRYIKYPNPRIC